MTADFIASLDGAEPPAASAPLLRAVWFGLRGDWAAAHAIAQAHDDARAAWVHAWLHRVEGDMPNARYWYGRAGRAAPSTDTRTEGLAIAAALLPGDAAA